LTQSSGRVIKPPTQDVTSGRTFGPSRALMFKKWLKIFLLLFLGWIAVWATLFSLTAVREIAVAVFEPLGLLVVVGWGQFTLIYWLAVSVILAVAALYIYLYVSRIEYSVLGWEGEAMPEVYCRKGIINITKRHVPFRTITYVRTRRGPFDRILGIGNVMVETAGGEVEPQASGLAALILRAVSGGSGEERIEGIRFDEELRDFILRELRAFGKTHLLVEAETPSRRKSRVLNEKTLAAFVEVRDALRERRTRATG
jgi:membrane protein YdbS with pleckstrin-like domain